MPFSKAPNSYYSKQELHMLRVFNSSSSMINLRKALLKNKNTKVQNNIIQCLNDLKIIGRVISLDENYKNTNGFQIILENSDKKQLKTEILRINEYLCSGAGKYIHQYTKHPIVFENSLNIKSMENRCNLIFDDIQELMFPKTIKNNKSFSLKKFAKSCAISVLWACTIIKHQIFEKSERKSRARISRQCKDSRLRSCIEVLFNKYTSEELENAEISLKTQISHKKTAPAFFRIIILAAYLYSLPYIGINLTTFLVSWERIIGLTSIAFAVLKVEDVVFQRFEHWNALAINYEETCLIVIQEAIKRKNRCIQ